MINLIEIADDDEFNIREVREEIEAGLAVVQQAERRYAILKENIRKKYNVEGDREFAIHGKFLMFK